MTLSQIQYYLKVPKSQHNAYGNYDYRSCEDILNAVKPLLAKYHDELKLDDDVVLIGNRFYVKATAIFKDKDGNTTEVHGFAREADMRKGMDESQITGSASSYARKYALNGLFLIDDVKDADTNQYQQQSRQPQNNQPNYQNQNYNKNRQYYNGNKNYQGNYNGGNQ